MTDITHSGTAVEGIEATLRMMLGLQSKRVPQPTEWPSLTVAEPSLVI